MISYKVAFAQFPGGGVSRMETNAWVVRAVREMDKDARIEKVVSLTYNDTPITMVRNRAVLEARQAGCQYLLMIDSDVAPDMPFPGSRPFWSTAWEFMMERRQKEAEFLFTSPLPDGHIYGTPFPKSLVERMTLKFPPATIGAPYCGPPPDECCYVFHWTSRGTGSANPDFQLEMIPRCSAAIRAGIQEVAALPTGLILYDMRVFDILPPPWFEYEWGDPPYNSKKATTEDVYQTRNASMLGLPQYCAWDSWAWHYKGKLVGKPVIVTRDQVHASLREAVLRGVDSDVRMIVLPEGPKTFQESIPSADVEEHECSYHSGFVDLPPRDNATPAPQHD